MIPRHARREYHATSYILNSCPTTNVTRLASFVRFQRNISTNNQDFFGHGLRTRTQAITARSGKLLAPRRQLPNSLSESILAIKAYKKNLLMQV